MTAVLIVTWDGGGNVPPALGLAAELLARGHSVIVLGHPSQRAEVEAVGAASVDYRTLPRWNPRALDGALAFASGYLRLFTDGRFGSEVRDAIDRFDPDVVVVDALLPAAMRAAVDSGRPTAVLVHTVLSAVEQIARGPVGGLAALKGFSFSRGLEGADALLIASPEAIATAPAPASARYVGPIPAPGETAPAEAERGSRRVLVSLSTIQYPGMQSVLQGLLDAIGTLPVEAVVTTGPAIDPADLRVPANAEVHRRVPHAEVLPHIGLVIGHGGHGTATKALTAGVPVLVRALSSLGDHLAVAAGLEHAGVGRRLSRRLSRDELAHAIIGALDDAELHDRSRAVGLSLRAMDGASLGADLVERTAGAARPGRTSP